MRQFQISAHLQQHYVRISWLTDRDLDDIIWANVILGHYEAEYAETYLERRTEEMGKATSEEERQLILGTLNNNRQS